MPGFRRRVPDSAGARSYVGLPMVRGAPVAMESVAVHAALPWVTNNKRVKQRWGVTLIRTLEKTRRSTIQRVFRCGDTGLLSWLADFSPSVPCSDWPHRWQVRAAAACWEVNLRR